MSGRDVDGHLPLSKLFVATLSTANDPQRVEHLLLDAFSQSKNWSWGLSGRSWTLWASLGLVLGGSWAVSGQSWELLGTSWGAPGLSRAVLGGSWGGLGRSEIDQKSVRKSTPKSNGIREGQNRSGATPVVVSELLSGELYEDFAAKKRNER